MSERKAVSQKIDIEMVEEITDDLYRILKQNCEFFGEPEGYRHSEEPCVYSCPVSEYCMEMGFKKKELIKIPEIKEELNIQYFFDEANINRPLIEEYEDSLATSLVKIFKEGGKIPYEKVYEKHKDKLISLIKYPDDYIVERIFQNILKKANLKVHGDNQKRFISK